MPKKTKKEVKLPPIPERGEIINVQASWMEELHYVQGRVLQTIIVSKIREYTPEAIDSYLTATGLMSAEEIEAEEGYDLAVCINCPLFDGEIWVLAYAVGDTFDYHFFGGASDMVEKLEPLPFRELKDKAKPIPMELSEMLEKISPTKDGNINPILLKLARAKLCTLKVELEFGYVEKEDLWNKWILTGAQFTKLLNLYKKHWPEIGDKDLEEVIRSDFYGLLSESFAIPIGDTEHLELSTIMNKTHLKELTELILDYSIIEGS